jgi:class 3 adenylate cyclase
MEIPIHREGIAENRKRWNLALAELMDLRHADTPSEAVRYESLIRERRALEDSMGRPAGALSGQDAQRKIADLTAAISAMEDDARTWLQRLASLWQDVRPTTDEERIEQERVRRLQQDILEGRLADRLHRADATIQSRIDELIGELRSTVASKICLIGYTASAVADLVATPVSNAMPGVMVHANVLNSMLQNRPAFRAPLGIQILLISACGLLTTLMTCAQRPWWSLLGMLLILAGAVAGSALTFQYFTLHLPSPAAAVTTITCWAVVTLYRQFIAERGHRRFQRALAQYTSSAIAQRIAESRGAESFTPHPAIVTCFFIDLAGFTRLSEQLGPDRTRRILNPFLSMVSRVLIDHDALVNKFMGDGVFAFFNAPLWPCAHHAKAACESALVIQRELDELNRSRRLADADAPLAARIGLATGEVFVGDYGSESKLDYTCIGDTVNLASRLEKINRYLGTRILIDEATCRAAGDRFAVRRLGRFLIAGKSRPVELIELAGLADTEDAQSQSYRRQFEVALADFQCCRADRGRRLFEECLRQSPDDRVVRRYLAAINAHPHASTAETSLTVLPLADFPSEEEETADGRFKSSPD